MEICAKIVVNLFVKTQEKWITDEAIYQDFTLLHLKTDPSIICNLVMAKCFLLICMADGVQSFAYLCFPQIVRFLSLTEPVSSADQI